MTPWYFDYQEIDFSAAEIGSAITNANALPYRGMYLDRVMLNAYKALNYFAINDVPSAHVELRRMREAQQKVVRKFDDELRASEQEIAEYNLKNQQKSRSLGNQNTTVSFSSIVKNPVVNEAYVVSEAKANKLYGNLGNPFVSYFSAIGYLLENNYGEALVDFRNLLAISFAKVETTSRVTIVGSLLWYSCDIMASKSASNSVVTDAC
jgi:hypothetical protein